jgi:hypothetical protein
MELFGLRSFKTEAEFVKRLSDIFQSIGQVSNREVIRTLRIEKFECPRHDSLQWRAEIKAKTSCTKKQIPSHG